MTMPGFTAENSLYGRNDSYALSERSAGVQVNTVIPAIPACKNCPSILRNCELYGWEYAICDMCATGNCYLPGQAMGGQWPL